MKKFGPVAVSFLLSLLTLPPCAVGKHAATSPVNGAPDTAPTAPPGERKPLMQQIRENPTKYGDMPGDMTDNKKDGNVRGKLNKDGAAPPHGLKTNAPEKKHPPVTNQTPTPTVPPKTVPKHLLQDVKENPTKYNDARPSVDSKLPGKKDHLQDQH